MSNQRTIIGGIGYNIIGGATTINGIGYDIKDGRTLINGVGYNILFSKPVNNVYTAQLYTDGDMSFQVNDRVDDNKTLRSSYTGWMTTNYTNTNYPWISQKNNIKNVYFDNIRPPSTAHWFYKCANLTTFDWSGLDLTNTKNMYCMFDYCEKLNANTPIRCGQNVTDFGWAYENCKLLTGTPVCGQNVTSLRGTYCNCYNLRGAPVCGPKVTDFHQAYYSCYNITGSAAWNNIITSGGMAYYCCNHLQKGTDIPQAITYARYIYGYCDRLTGAPVSGDNIVNFYGAYCLCRNITGSFVCGNNVSDMSRAYESCINVSGPARFGPNVKLAYLAYAGCQQLTEAYFNGTNKLTNIVGCFANKLNSRRLNIYVQNVSQNVWNLLLKNTANDSILARDVSWFNNDGIYYYNTTYNVYIYNTAFNDWVADTIYWPNNTHLIFSNRHVLKSNGVNMSNTADIMMTSYLNANSVPWHHMRSTLTTVNVLYPTVKPISANYWFYNCVNYVEWHGEIRGDDLKSMVNTYRNCYKLVHGATPLETVVNAFGTYGNCQNLIGPPVSTSNITCMDFMYENCRNITGTPVCGPAVTDMYMAYDNCIRLTGAPAFGPNVIRAQYAYYNCTNLVATKGRVTIGSSMSNMYCTFDNCVNLFTKPGMEIEILSPSVQNMTYCFRNTGFGTALNIIVLYVPHNSTTNTVAHQPNTYGLREISWNHPYPNFSVGGPNNSIRIYHYS